MPAHPLIAVRVDPPLLAAIDAFLVSMQTRNPDVKLTRTDAVRAILRAGLAAQVPKCTP